MNERAPWHILHSGHLAWRQRSVMVGDFAPGRPLASWYIVDAEGRAADPLAVPTCETCGVVPPAETLEVVEVATGQRGVLAKSRLFNRWPRPTDPNTCFWCNCPGLDMANGLLCAGCEAHLSERK